MQSLAFVTKYDKGKTVTHPFSNYTVVMFVQGYVTGFCVYMIRVERKCHKATTRNGVPQGIVLFLCLYNLVSRERHMAITRKGIP